MKKKIMIGLGAITAIAAPVVGLISCGEETLADKMISIYPNKIEVKASNKDFDFLKSMKTDGADINFNQVIEGISHLDDTLKKNSEEIRKDKDFKDFETKFIAHNATIEETAKVIKGFADNKITIEFKNVVKEIKPKTIDRGTATKEIEITFLAS